MTVAKTKPAPKKPSSNETAAVDEFMTRLSHPQKAAIQALRLSVRSSHPSIKEGIKWNAPSFRTTEFFATTHLQGKTGIGLILHLGARNRQGAEVVIKDPGGLLTWLAKDRAMIRFADLYEVQARKVALQRLVRQWIKFV